MGLRLKQTGNLSKLSLVFDKRGEEALDKAAQENKQAQQRILVANTKNPTGNLFISIDIKGGKKGERRIGPNQGIAPYAIYVEEGTGSFLGYHYVRNSIRAMQQTFNNLIRRSLERS